MANVLGFIPSKPLIIHEVIAPKPYWYFLQLLGALSWANCVFNRIFYFTEPVSLYV